MGIRGYIMQGNRRKLKLLYKIAATLNTSFDQFHSSRYSLSLEQVEFANHQLKIASYLEACPGSGKTEVVGIKAAYEIAKWGNKFSGLAILSFTKNAANEIKKRVMCYAGINAAHHPHYIGTLDSWLHSYILHPFAHKIVGYSGKDNDKSIRIIESSSKADFLNNYITQWFKNGQHYRTIWVNEFYININGDIETENDSLNNIDANIRSQLMNRKNKFFSDGFATYQDAEYLCYKIVKSGDFSKTIAQRFPVIIVDECQDLSPSHLALLAELKDKGTILHFVGDIKQAIYEFRKVDPALIEKYICDNKFETKILSSNFRSNQKIVDFCQNLLGGNTKFTGCQEMLLKSPCILWQYSEKDFLDLPERFEKFLLNNKINVNEAIILARGKTVISKLHPQEEKLDKPVELFANALNCWYGRGSNTEDIASALNEVGKSICYLAHNGKGNAQRQHCPMESASIDWRLFLAAILREAKGLYPFCDESGKNLTWRDWVSRLKKFLEQKWETIPFKENGWEDVNNKIKAPQGKASINVVESVCVPVKKTDINIATIHSVKGRTFDAVMLISSFDKRSKGGHFEHWIDNNSGNDEHERFAYVACSRPRHLLVIAVPKLEKKHIEIFKKLGIDVDKNG